MARETLGLEKSISSITFFNGLCYIQNRVTQCMTEITHKTFQMVSESSVCSMPEDEEISIKRSN